MNISLSYSITLTASWVEGDMKNSHLAKRLLCDSLRWNTTSLRSPSHGQTINILLFSGQVAFLYMEMAKWSAISLTGIITVQPYSKCGQENYDRDDIFSRLIFLIPLNRWLQGGHSSRGYLQVQHILCPFSQKVMDAVICSLHTRHCSCSISSAMLEAGISISTVSAIPSSPVTHMNQNSFEDIIICRTQF
jgi:hypothetical protein